MRVFRYSLFSLVLLLMMICNVQAQKTVWYADDLLSQEIESFYELFSLVSGWTNATNNDVTIQFSRNGLAAPGGAFWPVYLDGVKINQQLWNTQGLFFAPVNFNQVDSIVVVEQPMIYGSEFTEKGAVFIYSKTPDEGLKVLADVTFGNESGDPGPFVFTEIGSRNIERIGPVVSGSVSYRKRDFSIQVGGHAYDHPSYTSILQYPRVTPYRFPTNGKIQKIESNSIFFKADAKTGFISHQLNASASNSRDFLFTELYGVEVPVDREWRMVSYQGDMKVSQSSKASFQTSYSTNYAENLPNKDQLWLGWDQQVFSSALSLRNKFRNGQQEIGVKTELLFVEDNLSGNQLKNDVSNIYHQLELMLSEKLTLNSNSMVAYSEKFALKESIGLTINLTASQEIEVAGSFSQRLPQEDNSLWYWVADKGFGSDTLMEFGIDKLPEKSTFYQAKLGWRADLERFGVEVSTIWSVNQNEYAWKYQFIPNGRSIRAGNYVFKDDLNASFLKVPIKADYLFSADLRTSFSYTYTQKLSGSDAFFSMIPAHQVLLNINYKPATSFKLWSRFRFQSQTEWEMLSPIDGKVVPLTSTQSEAYSSDLDSHVIWDAGIKKGFWDQKLTFSLTMKNMLNQKYREHPISQKNALTMFLGAHLNLP